MSATPRINSLKSLFHHASPAFRHAVFFCAAFLPLVWVGFTLCVSRWNNELQTRLDLESAEFQGQMLFALDMGARTRLKNTAEFARECLASFQDKIIRKELSEDGGQKAARAFLEVMKIGKTGRVIALPAGAFTRQYPQLKRHLTNTLSETELRANPDWFKEGYVPSFDLKESGASEPNHFAIYAVWFKEWDWIAAAMAPRAELLEAAQEDCSIRDSLFSVPPPAPGGALHYLVDKSGQLLMHPVWGSSPPSGGKDALGFNYLAEIAAKKRGRIFYTHQQSEKGLLAEKKALYAELPDTTCIAVSEMDLTVLNHMRKTAFWIALALSLAALLGALPAARWRLSNRATRDATRRMELEAAANRLARAQVERLVREKEHAEKELAAATKEREKLKSKTSELTAELDNILKESEEINHLNKLADKLQACQSVEETYAIFAQQAEALFKGDSGAFYRFQSSQRLLELAAEWGETSLTMPPFAKEFQIEDCWGVRLGAEHLLQNPRSETRCAHLEPGPYGSICQPMMVKTELLGLLCLRSSRMLNTSVDADAEPPDWLKAKINLAKSVTKQYGLTLANLELREALRIQSIRDQLTGLYNRRHMEESFMRELHRAERQGSTLGLIMADIDHFKKINDTYGHEKGDDVLRATAAILQKSIRQGDIACRYGGEEFLVLLPEASLEITQARAEQIRQSVRKKNALPNQPVTMSLGVAMFPENGQTVEELQNAADAALYQAKHGGRDQVFVSSVKQS